MFAGFPPNGGSAVFLFRKEVYLRRQSGCHGCSHAQAFLRLIMRIKPRRLVGRRKAGEICIARR